MHYNNHFGVQPNCLSRRGATGFLLILFVLERSNLTLLKGAGDTRTLLNEIDHHMLRHPSINCNHEFEFVDTLI